MSTSEDTVATALLAELAPRGVLRVGINLSNFLLVSDENGNGEPVGVSPDIGWAIARELGVAVEFVTFPGPGEAADAAGDDVWDIVNIGAERERAKSIAFSPPYCEIQATCLLPPASADTAGTRPGEDRDASAPTASLPFAELDAPGKRIAVKTRSAYDLWLTENLHHAELCRADSFDASYALFVEQRLDALAGLRPKLLEQREALPGSVVLDESFTAVRQSIGCRLGRARAAAFLDDFVRRAIESGLIESLIAGHGVTGRLSVAATPSVPER